MNVNQIITIASIPIFASLVTLVAEHFLSKSRLKSERETIVEREILFNLQKQAEKIFFQLNKIRWNLDQMNEWLKSGNHNDFVNVIKNDHKDTLEQLSASQVYFSKSVFNKYDEVAKTFKEYNLISGQIILKKEIDINADIKIEREKIEKLAIIFNNVKKDCEELVLNEIEQQKKNAKK